MHDFYSVFAPVILMINAVLLIVLEMIDTKREKEKAKEEELRKEREKVKEAWKEIN